MIREYRFKPTGVTCEVCGSGRVYITHEDADEEWIPPALHFRCQSCQSIKVVSGMEWVSETREGTES